MPPVRNDAARASRARASARAVEAAALPAAVAVLVLATTLGPAHISLREAVTALGHRLSGHPDPHAWRETVIWSVRLPRALLGFVVGGGLAVAGAALQGLFRNPLADPGILGVSTGASLGAVLAIYGGLAARAVWALPAGSFAGAAVNALLVFALAARRGRGRVFTGTLLLIGVALSALAVSFTTFVLSVSLDSYDVGRQIVYWLLGGLEGRTWDHLLLGGPAVLVGAAVVLAQARELDALLLGELAAVSVGIDVARVRVRVVLGVSLVVGAAVAVAGPIGFVGLVVPHVLRLVVGARHRVLVPLSFVGGGVFVVAADIFARTLLAPAEIPVGIVTAALGTPVFLALLVRREAAAVTA
ncbi:MAG TPA: iron ABC transporter permease [Polyangia bacterium]|nr:iron ABC transporter permease [Polyangia bacterium]